MNFTTFGKKIENLTKYQLLVVSNITEDEHFSVGEFYKIPKRLAGINVSVDEHSAQKQEKSKKTYCLSDKTRNDSAKKWSRQER